MDLGLKDKVAAVTGGSRGIGKAIARALALEGVDIAIIARDRQVAEACAAEMARETGRTVRAYRADTADDAAVRAAFAALAADFGRLDILVNCAAQPAGQQAPPQLNDITDEAFFSDVNVKVMGYLRCARAAAELMRAQRWGRVINISGLAARTTGSIIGSVRNVSVAALTKNLADELAPFGINVTCVHPGLTRTEKTPAVFADHARAAGVSPKEIEQRFAAGTLVGRLIEAADVAAVVAFLASPKSVAINGDAIAAGGGMPGVIYY
jgi:NAD(P)-dependent dehydrogenase (short-subunit alcohol dehydrogenase family)